MPNAKCFHESHLILIAILCKDTTSNFLIRRMGFRKMKMGAGIPTQSSYPFGHGAFPHWGDLKPKEDRSVGFWQLMEQWDRAANVGLCSLIPVSLFLSNCMRGVFSPPEAKSVGSFPTPLVQLSDASQVSCNSVLPGVIIRLYRFRGSIPQDCPHFTCQLQVPKLPTLCLTWP